MPKVSEQYRDSRRRDILDAARRCFARDGFHQTSMQDVFAEAGLSSGAVYRYFPGKAAMILAIAQENIGGFAQMVRDAVATERAGGGRRALTDLVADVLEAIRDRQAADFVGGIALTTWAESLRDPALAQAMDESVTGIRAELTELARSEHDAGRLPAGVTPESAVAVLVMLVPGFIMQLTVFGADAVAGVPETVRLLWASPVSASAGYSTA